MRLTCLLFLSFYYAPGILADSEFLATPDYSYDSYRSRSTYSVDHNMNYSLSRRNNSASSRVFSSDVMIRQNRTQNSYSPTPVTSNTNNNPQYSSNSAYYRTNPYKY